jgi:4-hydroxy-tetrahydrodipicolinate synthase
MADSREAEANRNTLAGRDPLWVPLLTHYAADGSVDTARMAAHLQSIAGSVDQIMLAGSTGDGWEMDDRRFDALIAFAASPAASGCRIMFGILRPSTTEVVARVQRLEAFLGDLPELRERFVGVTICPPVNSEAGGEEIIAHYRQVLEVSTSAVAVYQLPQVTGCRTEPETLATLSANPRIVMFKDSSGEDAVAASGRDFGAVHLVRGAEGGYAEAVLDQGYAGWLLSSANVMPEALREIATLLRVGRNAEAIERSRWTAEIVERLFKIAADEGGANAFSNANRAGDHVRAHGAAWGDPPPPRKQDGEPLSQDVVARAAELLLPVFGGGLGYLHR